MKAQADVTAARARLKKKQAVRAATERIPLAQQGLEASQKSLRLSEARYQAGTALGIEVLEAEDTVARARLALTTTAMDHYRAQIALLAATGRINRDAFRSWVTSRPAP